MSKTLYVTCSFCSGLMEVDAETGDVIAKWPAGEKGQTGDKMESALRKIEDDKRKRAGLLDQKKNELAEQKKRLEDVFKKGIEKAKKEGADEKPFSPFDLD